MSARLSRRALLAAAGRVAATAPFVPLAGCALDDPPAEAWVVGGPTMGTHWRATVPAAARVRGEDALRAELLAVLERVDGRMSTYRPDAELARFNAAATTAWFDVSDETRDVVERALEVARRSDGAFDPTVGPLVDVWGFGPEPRTERVPPPAAVAARRAAVGAHLVETGAAPARLRKHRPDVRLDLSGIAKGHALDRMAACLDARGVTAYLLDVGGELRARGERAPGAPWRVGIERPEPGATDLVAALVLRDEALATSGDYRQCFVADGRRYGHLLDPRVGAPVDHAVAAVSVVATDAAEADAWATALLVLGPDAGEASARRLGLAALFVVRTPAGLVVKTTAPLDRRRLG
jgi:thiamine biosynthesis lipoprotein